MYSKKERMVVLTCLALQTCKLNRWICINAMWTWERFVPSRMAQWAVYYNALIPEHTYLSI